MRLMKAWLLQLLIAIDQLINALIGGWADETLSSRAWRMARESNGWITVRNWIDLIFRIFGERDHCLNSYMSEKLRAHVPPELRS